MTTADSVQVVDEGLAVFDLAVGPTEQIERNLSLAYVILGVTKVNNIFGRPLLLLRLLVLLPGSRLFLVRFNCALIHLVVLVEARFDISFGLVAIVEAFRCNIACFYVTTIFVCQFYGL